MRYTIKSTDPEETIGVWMLAREAEDLRRWLAGHGDDGMSRDRYMAAPSALHDLNYILQVALGPNDPIAPVNNRA